MSDAHQYLLKFIKVQFFVSYPLLSIYEIHWLSGNETRG